MTQPSYLYLIGPMPPPIGGVTIFFKRRSAQLRRQNVPHGIKDWDRMSWAKRLAWIGRILFERRPAEYELNEFETWVMLAILARPFPKRVVFWVHSGQFSYRIRGFRRWLFKRFLKTTDELVFVSRHIEPMFRDNDFHIPELNRVQYAFLPPDSEEETSIWESYDPETRDFIDTRRPLLAMQGSDAFYQGVDRYGTDLAIECMVRIKDRYPDAGLVVGRPTSSDADFQSYCDTLDARIAETGIGASVHFIEGERDLWPVTAKADVFLRPSNQDGDSISVREAMHFDVPVVASDACPRPDGVVLFTNRDPDDLAAKVVTVLESAEAA